MAMMWKDVIDKYGEKMADKIIESGYLDGVTVRYDDEQRVHFYDYDVEKAVKMIETDEYGEQE